MSPSAPSKYRNGSGAGARFPREAMPPWHTNSISPRSTKHARGGLGHDQGSKNNNDNKDKGFIILGNGVIVVNGILPETRMQMLSPAITSFVKGLPTLLDRFPS